MGAGDDGEMGAEDDDEAGVSDDDEAGVSDDGEAGVSDDGEARASDIFHQFFMRHQQEIGKNSKIHGSMNLSCRKYPKVTLIV